jgi:L-glyceraldehyde 3-phosphate reductase
LRAHRDELVISTKAGYLMWEGPYGEWGSRKYLLSSLDQSLKRLGLDYVDIFYHHRPDPDTPLEETIGALAHAVRVGKALYVGISNYPAPLAKQAAELLHQMGAPCLLHQPAYNMFNRWVEGELLGVLQDEGVGCIAFSPLAQGLLTTRYLDGIPGDSRAGKPDGFLRPEHVTEEKLAKVRALAALATERGQTLPQLAISWILRHRGMTSALIGASKVDQIEDAVGALKRLDLTPEELARIDSILGT